MAPTFSYCSKCNAEFPKTVILLIVMWQFQLFYQKVSDLARLVSLKNILFTQIWVFALVFFLVCLKQYMAVGEGSVNPPKNLRSRHGHDLDYCLLIIIDSIDWCRFHRPDIDFWWYQQCWKKKWPFKLLARGFIVRSSNFLPRLQL